jgi:hypothetical protein
MGAFKLGPFIIQYTWVLMILSGLITYFVLKKMLKEDQTFLEKFTDALINALLIGVIAYKGSVLLFRPELWVRNPLGALSLSGSWRELLAALLLSGAYLIWKYKKQNWPADLSRNALIYGFTTYILSYWLIRTLFFLF